MLFVIIFTALFVWLIIACVYEAKLMDASVQLTCTEAILDEYVSKNHKLERENQMLARQLLGNDEWFRIDTVINDRDVCSWPTLPLGRFDHALALGNQD